MGEVCEVEVKGKGYTVRDGKGYYDIQRKEAASSTDLMVRVAELDRGKARRFSTSGTVIAREANHPRSSTGQSHEVQTSVAVESVSIGASESSRRQVAATIAVIALGESIAAGLVVENVSDSEFDVTRADPVGQINHHVRVTAGSSGTGGGITKLLTKGVGEGGDTVMPPTDKSDTFIAIVTDRIDGQALSDMVLNVAAFAFMIAYGEFAT